MRIQLALSLLACLLAIAVPLPARALESYAATIDGSEVNPASSCVGHGTFTLSADETQLAYEYSARIGRPVAESRREGDRESQVGSGLAHAEPTDQIHVHVV